MDIFLLSNGGLSGNPQWLSYAQDRIRTMIKTRGIRSAVLIAYAVIRADHDQRASELSEALGIDVTCIEHFDSPVQAVENAECILVSGGNISYCMKMAWLCQSSARFVNGIFRISAGVPGVTLPRRASGPPMICRYVTVW